MLSKGAANRKVNAAKGSVQDALQCLSELHQAIQDGKGVSALLMHCEELGEALVALEGQVGVQTPLSLFA